MAGSNKPTFSFGQASSTSGNSGLFGSTTSTAPPSGGLFGSTSATPATSAGGLFGKTAAPAPSGSLFGSNAPTTQPVPSASGSASGTGGGGGSFGGALFSAASKPTTGGFNFGSASTNTAGGGGFGGFSSATAGTQASEGSNASAPPAIAPLFSTPSKAGETPAAAREASMLFKTAQPNATAFGKPSSTTPTNKTSTSLFSNSTTPAGPPPTTSAGNNLGSSFKFSNVDPKAPGAPPSFAPTNAPASEVKAGQVDGKKDQVSNSGQRPNIFGTAPGSSGASALFGVNQTTQPTTNLFGNVGKTQGSTQASANTQQGQPESKPASSLFSNIGTKSSVPDSTSGTKSIPSAFGNPSSQPTFNFPKASEPTPAASAKSPVTTSSGFTFANAFSPVGTSTPSSSAPAIGLFTNTAKATPKQSSNAAENAGVPAASASAAPSSSLFMNTGKAPATSASESVTEPARSLASDPKPAGSNLSASTAGPVPAPRSRLKDKTMDDIITRWASDLSKYQKQFQAQAERVAQWDRMLIENSEKIQRLYGSTLEVERATSEVERQLTAVESDQSELEQWLDHYEKEVDQMREGQIGQGDGLSGPDAERENTYQLATRISDRLEEVGKDLGSMIEEINDASSNLSHYAKPNDPLSQVVRVLNSHLTQLQQIDQGANALQLKVKEAQRAGQNLGHSSSLNGPGSEAAESFYRSYMGRG